MNDSPKPEKTAVLLVEDHPLTQYGLVSCLEDTGRFIAAGTVGSLEEGRRFIEEASGDLPGVVVLDILLGGENGLEFIAFLERFCKTAGLAAPAILVCSVFEDPFRVRTALRMGASGYVSKSASEKEFLCAVETYPQKGSFSDSSAIIAVRTKEKKPYREFCRTQQPGRHYGIYTLCIGKNGQ